MQREFDEQLVLAILLDQPQRFQFEIMGLNPKHFRNPLLALVAQAMTDLQASGRHFDYRRVGRMVPPSLRSSVHALRQSVGAEYGLHDALSRLQNIDNHPSHRVTVPLRKRSR